jgi:hypothetical protein
MNPWPSGQKQALLPNPRVLILSYFSLHCQSEKLPSASYKYSVAEFFFKKQKIDEGSRKNVARCCPRQCSQERN